VLLKGRVKITNDTPDFAELKTYCINIFEDEILKELRPDLDAVKSN
jgi:hypothetical protein